MDLENKTRRLRRRENGMAMASCFHIWMSPGHFHVVFDVASCCLNQSIICIGQRLCKNVTLHRHVCIAFWSNLPTAVLKLPTYLKAQYHLLSDVILRLRNITTMYFDRYLSCFGIKIQFILANLYKLKIEY